MNPAPDSPIRSTGSRAGPPVPPPLARPARDGHDRPCLHESQTDRLGHAAGAENQTPLSGKFGVSFACSPARSEPIAAS